MKKIEQMMQVRNMFTGKAMDMLRDGKVVLKKKCRNGHDVVTFFSVNGNVPYAMSTSVRGKTLLKNGFIRQTDEEIGVPVSKMVHRINRLLNSGYVIQAS